MIVTLTIKWKRRTKPRAKTAAASDPEREYREWTATRGVILRVLDRFPETLAAVRQALHDYRDLIERQSRGPHETG